MAVTFVWYIALTSNYRGVYADHASTTMADIKLQKVLKGAGNVYKTLSSATCKVYLFLSTR